MAKNPDYGPTLKTPVMVSYYSSVQKPDNGGKPDTDPTKWMYQLTLLYDPEDPETQEFTAKLTEFENERRAAHGEDPTDLTTAIRTKKDKKNNSRYKVFRCITKDKPVVLDTDGKSTGLEVYKDNKVFAVVVPKFNPDSFGKPVLALYLNGVRFAEMPTAGNSSTVALLGGDVTLVETEEVEMVEESEAVDLGALDVS